MQKKAEEVAVATTQSKETTATPTEEPGEGQEMSKGQGTEDVDRAEERADPGPELTQLKWSHVPEKLAPRKKVKATKTSVDPITLTEGDLFDINEMVRNVTKDTLEEVMTKQTPMLGVLRAQLKDLQVQPPQVGMMASHVATGTSEAE